MPGVVGSGDLVKNSPPRRLLLALLAVELACVAAWALTGNFWCCIGAVISGVSLVFTVLFLGD